MTKLGCREGCVRLLGPVEGATTAATLHAPDLTTRGRGTLPGRRLLTVELPQVCPSIHPRARNHERPTWRRIRSIGQARKRSCPPLARRHARANPRQARRSANGWPLHARQRASNRTRLTAGTPATTSRARQTRWRGRREPKSWLRRRRSRGGSASGIYSEQSLRPRAQRGRLSQQQPWRRKLCTEPNGQLRRELPRPRPPRRDRRASTPGRNGLGTTHSSRIASIVWPCRRNRSSFRSWGPRLSKRRPLFSSQSGGRPYRRRSSSPWRTHGLIRAIVHIWAKRGPP